MENENVEIITNIQEIIERYEHENNDAFVIGGGKVYKELLPYCTKLYITQIDANDSNADTYFPEFNKKEYIKKIIGQRSHNNIQYKWVVYTRV